MNFLLKHLCFHVQPRHFAELLLNSKKQIQQKYSIISV